METGFLERRLTSLTNRHRLAEQMDDPQLDANLHRHALAALARLNAVSGTARLLWRRIAPLAKEAPGLRILDVASGAGDIPVRIQRHAQDCGIKLWISGCDISPIAVEQARQLAERQKADVEFFQCDVHRADSLGEYDVVLCSLFLHHLQEEQAIALLSRISAAARRSVFITDLHRSAWNLAVVQIASRVLTRSSVVRFDGPASVRSAFTSREALALARRAGLEAATVTRHFPSRFLLSWSRA